MVDDVVWLLWFLIQIENLEGKTRVVLLILMNTSSIMSTKFACVLDWSEISMVPIISIGYKTTYLFFSLKTKSSPDPKGFVICQCTPWYVPTSQTIAPLRIFGCKNLNTFMTCLHISPCCAWKQSHCDFEYGACMVHILGLWFMDAMNTMSSPFGKIRTL